MPEPDPDHPQRCDECAAYLPSPGAMDAHETVTGHDSGVRTFNGP